MISIQHTYLAKETLYYVRPLTGATSSIEMPYLESIEEQDILDWKRRFLKSAEICGWSVEDSSDYLLALSSLKIRSLYGQQNNPSFMLQSLIQKKYSLNSAERCHAKLMELHLNKFHDIADFAIAIDSVLVRWAAATKPCSELVIAKRESIFLQGLSPETLNFMNIQVISGSKLIYDKIYTTEERISTRIKEKEYLRITNNFQNTQKTPRFNNNNSNPQSISTSNRGTSNNNPTRYKKNYHNWDINNNYNSNSRFTVNQT